ncbi:uncharacterized protein [Spinacia oleracea]|uniref:Uncharacterized protein n=1 Tax=Spinacia oleracea TaxID=3562 RepID=A0A9R0INS9_SPIOL|nr:uncharacterized protein LOC110792208 [Spinacia oleracea]
MKASVDQNSAGILSVWHCIFTVSGNKDAEEGLKEEKKQEMIEMYGHMKHLRLAIHGIENPDLIGIPEIAKPFNSIFSGMTKENLIQDQINSFMREVANMRQVMKDIKNCSSSSLYGSVGGLKLNDNTPKYIISFLILWYWLAVWSSSDKPENHGAKDEFIEVIEMNKETLGFFLVGVGTPKINPKEQQELLQTLLYKLLQMLKSDHQFWTEFIDQFLNKMIPKPEAPKTSMNLHIFWGALVAGIVAGVVSPFLVDGIKEAVKYSSDHIEDLGNAMTEAMRYVGEGALAGVSPYPN